MTRVYTRKHPGLSQKLRNFFEANPHEELSLEDIIVKFSCSEASAREAVKSVNAGDMLERVSVYRRKAT